MENVTEADTVDEHPRPGEPIGFWEAISSASIVSLAWSLIAAVLVAAIAGSVIVGRSPTYESQAVLLIDQPTSLATAGDPAAVEKLSRLRAKYLGLVQTQTILEPTADRAGLPLSVVSAAVVAPRVPPPTLTFVVAAQGGDRQQVRRITEALAATVVDFVEEELRSAGIPPEERYGFEIVNPATRASRIDDDTAASLTAAAVSGLITLAIVYTGVQLLTARRRLG